MRNRRSWIALLVVGLCWLAQAAQGNAEQLAGKPPSRPPISTAAFRTQADAPKERAAGVHWTFHNADVQTLLARLKRFGVELPLSAQGRVTVRLSLSAPWRSLFRTDAYEVDGDLTSPELTIAGVELKNLAVHLQYKDGTLDLSQMRFTVPGKAGAEGTMSGHARMQVRPPGDLNAQLSIEHLPLSSLAGSLPTLKDEISGTVSGRFSGHAAADRFRELSAWEAEGRLTLSQVVALGLPAAEVATDLRLTRGQASLTNLQAQLEGARISGSAGLTLKAPYAFRSRLRVAVPDLSWLNRLEADFRPPVALAGNFALSADADGQLSPRRVRVRGTVEGRDLKADKITVNRLQVPYEGTLDRIRVRALLLELYGGRIVANLALPTTRDGNVGAGVRIDNVDLAHAASDLLGQKQTWRGAASGLLQLQAPATRLQQLDAWSGHGQLSFGRGSLLGIDVSRMATRVQVAAGRLDLTELAIDSAFARITGSAHADLAAPFAFSTALRIAEVDFAPLNRLPQELRPPVTIAGRAGISFKAEGTLQPVQFTARGGVATRRLRADQLVVESLNFNYQLTPQTLTLSQIAGAFSGGRIDGSATLGLANAHDFSLKLNATNVDFAFANTLPARFRPPLSVGGSVTFSASLKGQVAPLAIEGGGQFTARNVRVDRARFDSFGFKFAGDQNLLNISELALVAYRGRLDGRVALPLAEAAQGAIDVRWQRLNLGGLLTDLRGAAARAIASGGSSALGDTLNQARLAGWTWGSLSVTTPPGKLLDPAAWTGKVNIDLAAMRLFGWTAKQGFVKGSIVDGRAELSRLDFEIGRTRLRGSANLNLGKPYDFQSRFSLDNFQLADMNELPEAIRPPVKVSGAISVSLAARGTLEPFEITGNGSIRGSDLEADGARVDNLTIRFDANKDRLAMTSFRADLYGGQVAGEAEFALGGDNAGRVDFNWQEINLGQLITDLAKLPVTLRGTLAGRLHMDVPKGKLADLLAWNVEASFDTSPVGTRSTPLGELHGRLVYNGRLLDYRIDGTLLRGAVELAGLWQPRTADPVAVNEGHFHVRTAQLDAITHLVGSQAALGSVTGTVSADVVYTHSENGLPVGSGQLAVDNVRLNGDSLLDEVRGSIRLTKDRLEITNADASLAGGSLNLSAIASLDVRRRGSFRLNVTGAELAQLLAAWPQTASKARGVVDAQLQGFFGGRRPLIVNGIIALARGRAAGIDISSVRMPVNGSIDPGSGRGTFALHGVTGQIAHGRLTGDFDATLDSGLGLSGRGRLADIDLRTLLQQSASASRLASGKITGSYTVAGRNIRTINDLTGTLDATLRNTQAMSLPILERTTSYLTGGVSGSTTFDEGTVRASLARGVIRVDRFSLSSGSAQIYAQGKIALSGRLDLNVTVNTGQLNVPRRTLSLLASRILLVAAPPVGLLVNITQFLSNQVIQLEVSGTIRSPVVRIRPLNLLGQEAAQFFLLQSLP